MTRDEKLSLIRTYLLEHPDSSAREIADAVLPGVDNRGYVVGGLLRYHALYGTWHVSDIVSQDGAQTWRLGRRP